MPSVRLNKLAKELQLGVQSVIDFLSKKKPTESYNPNSKLTTDELDMVVRDLGNTLSETDKKALVEKFTSKPEAPKPAPEPKAAPAPKATEAHKDGASLSGGGRSHGPKVVGKVNLDKKGNVIPPSKPEAPKIEEPVRAEKEVQTGEKKPVRPEEKKEPVPEEKKVQAETRPAPASAPKTETVKPEAPKAEEPKAKIETPAPPHVEEAPAPTPKAASEKAPSSAKEKPEVKAEPVQPVRKEPAKKEEAPKSETQPASSKDEIFRIGSVEPIGVKVIGHVDLSKMEIGRGSRRKEKRKRTVVKGSEKIDIEKQAREESAGGSGGKKGGNGQKSQNKDGNRKQNNQASKEAVGRKAKAQKKKQQQQREQPHEITQEEIQKQIKETMAAIQGRRSGSGNSAKYRRDKREERRRGEELQHQAEMEAGKQLQLTEFVTPNDLAQMMDVPVNNIIALVFNLGMMVSINQRLDKDTIELIASEYGYEANFVDLQVADAIEVEEDNEEDLEPRAPIVTVMGHVDHGKTSLLDAIRDTDVIAHEAGGITQHVGAYRVTLDDDRSITFLDTPGHEAFTAMRARGAQVTDVVIIVVAADDGVMPQTKEAISHASLAGVPIVFAINKIDKPGANPDKIKEELANMNYLVEDWGGKYQSQEISAKKGIGIKELLEKVLLEAEVLELKANPHKRAIGSVLESTMEQGRGYTTKVLVQDGTLHVGDYIVAGSNYGRVKALFDDRGKNVQSVGPSEPVKVLGLNGATAAGETLNVMETESEVRDIASKREQLQREQRERTQRMPSLMDLGRRIAEGKAQELNIIVKGDMDGSVEALSDSIEKLSTDEIHVHVIYKGVGQITESDVSLASASGAVIIGFQVRPAQGAKRIAEDSGVEIRTYSVIYDALDDVKTAMEGMLSPETKERVTSNLEVREIFKISKVGTIAGCFVTDGKISRSDKIRVIRNGVVVHTGELASLKRFKDDAKEVASGLECGISIVNYNDIQAGDEIEAYQEYEVKRTLE